MASDALLVADGIAKSFGPTKALVDVSLEIKCGQIHGLIGENGSGKSTFASIVAGVRRADRGTMNLDGAAYDPASLVEGSGRGVSIVVQELGTVANVSVSANIFMGLERRFSRVGVLDIAKMNTKAKQVLNDIGVSHIDPSDLMEQLTFEDRKLVELARATHSGPKLLIIDETTTALSIKGRNLLYSLIGRLRADGKSVIFITHDIDEMVAKCDAITILRDGHFISTLERQDFRPDRIRQLMVGRDLTGGFYRADYSPTRHSELAMKVVDLSGDILRGINLELYKGEILGIGGLTECGMHDLGRAMFGLTVPDHGYVETGDGIVVDSPITAIRNRIGYLPKDRDNEALMLAASIEDNICLPSLDSIKRTGLISRSAERRFAERWMKELNIKASSLGQFCMYLSGGNKQKVALGKWLGNDSDILIMDSPTRGIDVGVKAAIYHLMSSLKSEGKAILMISEELPELIGMSDRVIVLKDGVVSGEFERNVDLTESRLIGFMI